MPRVWARVQSATARPFMMLQALPAVPPEALRKPEDGAKVDEAETGKQVLKEEQEPKADGKPANAAPISDK